MKRTWHGQPGFDPPRISIPPTSHIVGFVTRPSANDSSHGCAAHIPGGAVPR